MLEIKRESDGRVVLIGRFDASQVDAARIFFDDVKSSCVVDFSQLRYISSAGLGVLLGVERRLKEHGHHLKLIGMNPHIKDVFLYAGLDHVFEIE